MVNYGGKELAKAFRTVRGNTLQAAEEIPEDRYDFVPAPGTRTVSELLRHIAFSDLIHYDFHRDRRLSTLAGYDFGAFVARLNREADVPRSKSEIVALLRRRGDEFAAWLESLTPDFLNETFLDSSGQNPRTRFDHLLGAKEHEMHHRGQIMLIQRLLGITPHLTRRAQERMRPPAATASAGATAGAPPAGAVRA